MPEWLIGFMGGVIATTIGSLLMVGWDILKFRRESRWRDETICGAIREELLANLDILRANQRLFEQKLAVLDQRMLVVTPLSLLQTGFWDLAKVNLPQRLIRDGDMLISIRNVSRMTDEVNETIRSRENYRLHNGAMSNSILL